MTVKGTAVDDLGNPYVFNYHNNTYAPPTGELMSTDRFNLVEHGGSLTLGCDPI